MSNGSILSASKNCLADSIRNEIKLFEEQHPDIIISDITITRYMAAGYAFEVTVTAEVK